MCSTHCFVSYPFVYYASRESLSLVLYIHTYIHNLYQQLESIAMHRKHLDTGHAEVVGPLIDHAAVQVLRIVPSFRLTR
jgi:hypothetical protein